MVKLFLAGRRQFNREQQSRRQGRPAYPLLSAMTMNETDSKPTTRGDLAISTRSPSPSGRHDSVSPKLFSPGGLRHNLEIKVPSQPGSPAHRPNISNADGGSKSPGKSPARRPPTQQIPRGDADQHLPDESETQHTFQRFVFRAMTTRAIANKLQGKQEKIPHRLMDLRRHLTHHREIVHNLMYDHDRHETKVSERKSRGKPAVQAEHVLKQKHETLGTSLGLPSETVQTLVDPHNTGLEMLAAPHSLRTSASVDRLHKQQAMARKHKYRERELIKRRQGEEQMARLLEESGQHDLAKVLRETRNLPSRNAPSGESSATRSSAAKAKSTLSVPMTATTTNQSFESSPDPQRTKRGRRPKSAPSARRKPPAKPRIQKDTAGPATTTERGARNQGPGKQTGDAGLQSSMQWDHFHHTLKRVNSRTMADDFGQWKNKFH